MTTPGLGDWAGRPPADVAQWQSGYLVSSGPQVRLLPSAPNLHTITLATYFDDFSEQVIYADSALAL